jgi:hypothetical protein
LCLVLLASAEAQEKPLDFAHEVVPILRKHCGKCHTGAKKEGALSLNTRASLLAGGESGPAVVSGKSGTSELIQRITSSDATIQMPPEGPRLSAEEVAVLKRWIDGGVAWQEGFAFQASSYEPPLAPRRPMLPPSTGARQNPLDLILRNWLTERKLPRPQPISDEQFLRRVSLDLVGLLPTPEQREKFLADSRPDKRARLVNELLADDVAYAEHWLTFWNDLLRNDYTGTGFITGGRKQITKWLYEALVTNKPYDQFARELIAPPTPDSAGFIEGIKWRGEVSAGQTVEIQFAQSIGQSLLGINLKCASCHDSFIDRWKLSEAYGLAAIYATRPLPIHRCDKPTGDTAQAAWLFPELGQIDAAAAQSERLKQLAALMTHRENGRFTRTIVNRLWHRLMGRGIVHPVDAMQSEPWNADLLDYLAVHLADSGYDLKRTLALIATSEAYQSQCERVQSAAEDVGYVFAGPRARRLTAEQFLDAVWQLTSAGPTRYDAPVLRGKPDPAAAKEQKLTGQWIWSKANTRDAAAGETITFRKQFDLKEPPAMALAAISCDNSYTLFVNGQQAQAGDNWEAPDAVVLTPRLKAGQNELLVVAKNAGNAPNPAGMFCEVRVRRADGTEGTYATDASWEWTTKLPNANGRYPRGAPTDWQPAAAVEHAQVWNRLDAPLAALLARGASGAELMVRASLVKSDFLMRTLGRPNRDQIVTVRPSELTTLEAIDLANGEILAGTLRRGAERLLERQWQSPEHFVRWLYEFALTRQPSAEELLILQDSLGKQLTPQGIEDALWTVIMLPEFQLVR